MPGTGHLLADQDPFNKRSAAVRTGVVTREKPGGRVVEDDFATGELQTAHDSDRQFCGGAGIDSVHFRGQGSGVRRDGQSVVILSEAKDLKMQ